MEKNKYCTAKTRAGKKCKRYAMANGKCAVHGGMNKPGVDHPATKHGLEIGRKPSLPIPGGRKATGLPTRFYDDVMAASEDANLTSLYDEILIIDARISDLLKRVDSGESGEMWQDLRSLVENYYRSDVDTKPLVLLEIFDKIQQGSTDHQMWLDINMNIDQKARIIRAETARMKDMDMLIRADRVLLLIRAVVEVVMRKVPDPAVQESIRVAVSRLLDRPEVNLQGGL